MSSSAKTTATTAAIAVGGAYLLYRSIPSVMTALTKLQLNPANVQLGQLIQEWGSPSYDEISALGIVEGKSALVVGGTRGVGYGTALALARSGASLVTVVGRNESSGSEAVVKIRNELPVDQCTSSGCEVNFLKGDIGTVASTSDLLKKLVEGETRYDYLIVTAAIFTQPKSRNKLPLNDDGVEKAFGIGVVGRFLLYRKAHIFMKSLPKSDESGGNSPMILNVCASGTTMPFGFNRRLVWSLGISHMFNVANFAIGNELMLHKLVQGNTMGNSDGTPFSIPIITTHPGYLQTDLHRGQGFILDVVETFLVHFMGCTEEECGRREVSLICAVGSKSAGERSKSSNGDNSSLLTIVDNFGHGRLINNRMNKDVKDHGDWLWDLLALMESGGSIENYKD